MTRRQLTFGGMILLTIVITVFAVGYVSIQKYRASVEINAQTEIEKTKIEEKTKLERTRERMNIFPWYKNDK